MARVTTGAPSNGIEIAYETHGDPNDDPCSSSWAWAPS